MIVQERTTINGTEFLHTYSDSGMMLLQAETGILYGDAIDVIPCRYTYEETDQPIESEENDEEFAF